MSDHQSLHSALTIKDHHRAITDPAALLHANTVICALLPECVAVHFFHPFSSDYLRRLMIERHAALIHVVDSVWAAHETMLL